MYSSRAHSRRSPSRGTRRGNNSQFRHNSQRRRSHRPTKAIDSRKFVNTAQIAKEKTPYEPQHTFSDFNFVDVLQRNIAAKKYVHPTPIQDQAIKPAMAGSDIVGLADTGSGKTAAFILPLIHRLKTDTYAGPALIVAPTRELAQQIDDEFRSLTWGTKLYSTLCVGGMPIYRQKKSLARRPQVVIGTPGRLKDLFEQRSLVLNSTNILVLDEADRMLDMGFINDIRFLLEKLPDKRQILCFSATMTSGVERLLDGLLKDPVQVAVKTSATSEHINQDVIRIESKEQRLDQLIELLNRPEYNRSLVFAETKWGVQRLADTLSKRALPAEAIHGNKSQPQRQRALNAFKDGRASVLVATDVAARGLDVPNVDLVVNYDQPQDYDTYLHRIGRTGRAGNAGQAFTFI